MYEGICLYTCRYASQERPADAEIVDSQNDGVWFISHDVAFLKTIPPKPRRSIDVVSDLGRYAFDSTLQLFTCVSYVKETKPSVTMARGLEATNVVCVCHVFSKLNTVSASIAVAFADAVV